MRPAIDAGDSETTGSWIGRYQLLQKIGEGGMGEVWLAEQKDPVQRQVALKLVKPGMNTREVIARFHSERQALAMMQHPAIAKVLDAGSTPEGTPYFVMEMSRAFPSPPTVTSIGLAPEQGWRYLPTSAKEFSTRTRKPSSTAI